ncbi:MAG: hypothetical protein HQL52_16400 [Magnetococcales bacterium]|nr:hypothetical protein [Magnetococcales bacterium]
MTKTQLKELSDLPEWFNLKNYKDANKLDACGWYVQFARRRGAYYGKVKDENGNNILFQGIIGWDNFIENCEDFHASSVFDLSVNESRRLAVEVVTRHMDMYETDFIEDNLRFQTGNQLDGDFVPSYDDAIETFRSGGFHSYLNGPESLFPALEIAIVDVEAPDEQIISDFEVWLERARKRKGCNPRKRFFTKSDFSRWVDAQTLPYLDLRQWANMNNVKIPNRLMGDAILGSGNVGDTAERIRKTTKKIAHEMISGFWQINQLEKDCCIKKLETE